MVEASKIQLIFSLTAGGNLSASSPDPEVSVSDIPYGCVVSDYEWSLVIQFTGRQDGRVAWTAVLTEIDGDSQASSGLCKEVQFLNHLAAAVTRLTERWINPIKPGY